MGEINCRLHEILELLDLNKHHMSQHTGVRRATLLLMEKNKLKRLDILSAVQILDYLNDAAYAKGLPDRFTLDDIFTYTYKKES